MKENRGITMVTLVITIVVLLIIAGISVGTGNNVIKESQLENLKTNMLLIKLKGKEYVENANFKLGTNIENATDKDARIESAKAELKIEQEQQINISDSILNGTNIDVSDTSEYIYYYKLSSQNLIDIGLTNVKSDEDNGWYIIKYDVQSAQVEVYNTKGFENDENKYYSLTEIQDLNI